MFADGFETRMSDLMNTIRCMTPVSCPFKVSLNIIPDNERLGCFKMM